MQNHSVHLELSQLELVAMRAALADYAVLAYRQGVECNRIGAPAVAAAWCSAEIAAVELLAKLPPPRGAVAPSLAR